MNKKKRFMALMLLICLLVANIVGVYQQKSCVSAKTNTKKYHVKEQYMRDLGKKFKTFKKKYGWTLTNGSAEWAARFDYQIPKKKIWYTFQGDDFAGEWKMNNDTGCMRIRMKAKTLIKGFKGKMKISKFVSRLNSKKKKASWKMGAPAYAWGGKAAIITFYAKNGQEYRIYKDMDSDNDRWIAANDWVELIKVHS